jgi:hypothetical protein
MSVQCYVILLCRTSHLPLVNNVISIDGQAMELVHSERRNKEDIINRKKKRKTKLATDRML